MSLQRLPAPVPCADHHVPDWCPACLGTGFVVCDHRGCAKPATMGPDDMDFYYCDSHDPEDLGGSEGRPYDSGESQMERDERHTAERRVDR